ncbi:hypothetical protein JHK86_000731 [Glycine max]|nr:hypothetical protein JHK86_000731 [Glycine max]
MSPSPFVKLNVGSSLGNPGASEFGGILRDHEALNLILHNGNASHPYNALISLIRNCINQPWNVTFMHTLREGNACADWLAKHGATHEDNLTIWHACSPQLDTLVLADRIGVVHFKT